MCTLIEQLRRRRSDLGFSLTTLEKRTGFALPRLSVIFNRPKAVDLRLSSVEALADALDARVMVVPEESVALVQSLLSSHASLMAVEQTPSALEPALSLSYNSLDEITGDADTREIFTKSGTRWTRSLGAVPAFFENLLPEGALLDWIADQRQVSTHDAFELLAATGSSLPGALVIRPSDIERLGARLERHAAALQEG